MIFAFIIFVLIAGFLIFIHEFGHFITAKRSNVLVEEFGFGYPPRIFGKKIGETIYSINLIPFGGFVRIHGENREKDLKDKKRSFYAQRPSIKAKILLAGVVANLLVGIVVFYILLISQNFNFYLPLVFEHRFIFGQQREYPVISQVLENSPAQMADLKSYDLILSANSISFRNANDFVDFVNENKGKEISLEVKNLLTNESREVLVIPRENPPAGQGPIGIAIGEVAEIKYSSFFEKLFSGILHSINVLHYSLTGLANLIKASFAQQTIRPLASSVTGPIGILALTKMTLAGGIWQVLNLLAIISLGLAVINILPIPAADGGKMIFVAYEAIFRKRAPESFERKFNLAGYIFIIVLLTIITLKDIIQFKDILF
jgi:regulator of sigma E protease